MTNWQPHFGLTLALWCSVQTYSLWDKGVLIPRCHLAPKFALAARAPCWS